MRRKEQHKTRFNSGQLGICSMYARPQVGPTVHVMREAECGRYLANNLNTCMWVERYLQYTDDRELVAYANLKKDFLTQNLYKV